MYAPGRIVRIVVVFFMRFQSQEAILDPHVFRPCGIGLIFIVNFSRRPNICTPLARIRFAINIKFITPDKLPVFSDWLLGANHNRTKHWLVYGLGKSDVQLIVGYGRVGNGNGQCAYGLTVAKQHHVQIVQNRLPFNQDTKDALAPCDLIRFCKMQCDVIVAIWERACDLDITFTIALIQKRVLRAFHFDQLADVTATYGRLCLVVDAVNTFVSRTANVHRPGEIGFRFAGLATH